MKDKWLKDIHDRMADYEINEPDGLWEDIQADLSRPNDTHLSLIHISEPTRH